ncbi:hypothetical protein H206_05398 [Candidatus Electrothrix aarhusensis]|uniref:Uncharacterized protein n=1 Tax=Candidatus Electrothrix aarhusensis TaxID=1859131 RepID=A0A444J4L2_9BACT|nr:hypothetical protein H206_05398 [Candidatus Electrothrix aarhusensis]
MDLKIFCQQLVKCFVIFKKVFGNDDLFQDVASYGKRRVI